MGDEKTELKTGPYKGYTLNLDDNTLSGDGEYDGEVLASCGAKDGYLRVPGLQFTGKEMEKLRGILNIGTSRLFLDTQALIPGTICLKVDDPAQNEFALEQLDEHCPLKDEDKCEAVADTIEKSKPDSDIGKELLITCLLGFGILAPLGTMLIHAIVDVFKGKGGGKGGGDGGPKGGSSKPIKPLDPPKTLPELPDLVPNQQVMGFVDFLNETDGNLLESSKNAVKPSPVTASTSNGAQNSPSLVTRPVPPPPVVRPPALIRIPVRARVVP